jgi:hypothetical protein
MQYIRVDKAPEKLKANETVIHKPNFLEEIKASKGRRGVDNVATVRSLRDALMAITDKYDNTINPYHLKYHRYDNLMYEGDEGFAAIILRIIADNDLPLIDKAIEFELLKRKPDVDTVYYVSDDLNGSTAFIKHGFHLKTDKKGKSASKSENVV